MTEEEKLPQEGEKVPQVSDQRLDQVETDKNAALQEMENTLQGMVDKSDKFYQDQIQAQKDWADKQSQIQQEKTEFEIEKAEQQKEQAHKDYLKEQSGAYTDWQKQSNQYGANAEKMAAGGFTGTGFSESSQVGMYNAYQNRVAMAKESYNKAVLNYDNAMKEARLQNSAVLAEIAFKALQTELELTLQGFQYKNQLLLDKANKKLAIEEMYHGRYMDIMNQINQEKAFEEQKRQFDMTFNARYGDTGGGGGSSSGSSKKKKKASSTKKKPLPSKGGGGSSITGSVNKDFHQAIHW